MRPGARQIGGLLRHPDPAQLFYQLDEIVSRRTYTRHGVDAGPGDMVLDVGANVGVAAAFFAAVCEVARVHSFEPITPIFDLLSANIAQFPACAAHNLGLSSTAEEVELTYYPGATAMSGRHADPGDDRGLVHQSLLNRGVSERDAEERLRGSFEPVTVPCRLTTVSAAMRELQLERIDLLKIDVEKAELEVLRGVDDEDWPRVRQVAMESHDAGGRAEASATLLRERGFEVTVEQDALLRGTGLRMIYATRA